MSTHVEVHFLKVVRIGDVHVICVSPASATFISGHKEDVDRTEARDVLVPSEMVQQSVKTHVSLVDAVDSSTPPIRT